jgi:hypothetical protein
MSNDDRLATALADSRRATRDQVTAIWQTQMDHLRDAISRDWREQIARVIDDRFSEFESTLQPQILESRRDVVRSFGRHWNECFRRMRAAASDAEWCDALLDAAGGVSKRCAFFSVKGEAICFQSGRGFDVPRQAEDVPIQLAPAFLEVALSGIAADARRSASDLSPSIAALVGEDAQQRVTLVAVATDERVVGVLYVENPLEIAAVEAIATVAGIALTRRLEALEPVRPSSVVRAMSTPAAEPASPSKVAAMVAANPVAEKAARVAASRMLMEHYGEVKAARGGQISAGLQREIERARREFDHPVSYFDAEIARVLAQSGRELVRR